MANANGCTTSKLARSGNGRGPDVADVAANHEAEMWVLSSILFEQKMLPEADSLQPDDFHDQRNRIIFRNLQALGRADAVDIKLLMDRLRQDDEVDLVGADYLAEVLHTAPTSLHVGHYSDIVKRSSLLRRVQESLREAMRQAQQPGADPSAIARRTASALELHRDGCHGIEYPARTCPQLMAAQFDLDYLIPGVLVAGQPCLLFGPQKAMKTSLVLDLGVALAIGGHFLGYFKASRAAKVAVMSGESGMATVKETLGRIIEKAGISPDHVGRNLIITDHLPKFGQPDHLDAMERFIRGNELDVVVIDPAYLCIPADDNGNLFSQGEVLGAMGEVFSRTGTTLILIHHSRKAPVPNAFAPPELQDAAWSGFAEWARQWIMVGRRNRYEPGTGQHELWLSVGGSAGHGGLWALNIDEGPHDPQTPRRWDVSLRKPDDVRQETEQRRGHQRDARRAERQAAELDADRSEIVAIFTRQGGPQTKNGTRETFAAGHRRFDRAFGSLVQDGTLTATELTKANGQKYDGWTLQEAVL